MTRARKAVTKNQNPLLSPPGTDLTLFGTPAGVHAMPKLGISLLSLLDSRCRLWLGLRPGWSIQKSRSDYFSKWSIGTRSRAFLLSCLGALVGVCRKTTWQRNSASAEVYFYEMLIEPVEIGRH